jgi:hypothetical protein
MGHKAAKAAPLWVKLESSLAAHQPGRLWRLLLLHAAHPGWLVSIQWLPGKEVRSLILRLHMPVKGTFTATQGVMGTKSPSSSRLHAAKGANKTRNYYGRSGVGGLSGNSCTKSPHRRATSAKAMAIAVTDDEPTTPKFQLP